MVEDHSKGIGFERELSQDLSLDSLFHVADLQGIQDSIAMAMGVASIITRPDGSYFTEPSNLCSLCRDVIIPSDRGKLFCGSSGFSVGNRAQACWGWRSKPPQKK